MKFYIQNLKQVKMLGEHIIKKTDLLADEYQIVGTDLETMIKDIQTMQEFNNNVLSSMLEHLNKLLVQLNQSEKPIKQEEVIKEDSKDSKKEEVATKNTENKPSVKENSPVDEVEDYDEDEDDHLDDDDYEQKMNRYFDNEDTL